MRLIHYKITDGFGIVTQECNIPIGGNGPLTTTALDLVLRKISSDNKVPDRNVIIGNVMDILEK